MFTISLVQSRPSKNIKSRDITRRKDAILIRIVTTYSIVNRLAVGAVQSAAKAMLRFTCSNLTKHQVCSVTHQIKCFVLCVRVRCVQKRCSLNSSQMNVVIMIFKKNSVLFIFYKVGLVSFLFVKQ